MHQLYHPLSRLWLLGRWIIHLKWINFLIHINIKYYKFKVIFSVISFKILNNITICTLSNPKNNVLIIKWTLFISFEMYNDQNHLGYDLQNSLIVVFFFFLLQNSLIVLISKLGWISHFITFGQKGMLFYFRI